MQAWSSRQPGSNWSWLAVLMGALMLGLLQPAVARAEGLEVSDSRTENFPRVIVRFSAHAPDGLPITNIKPSQLKVWENGVLQEQVDLYSLRESSPALWVTLVMDVSGSMNDEDKLVQAKAAAKAFISRLRSRDRTAIVTFSDKVILQQQPTGDPGVLRRAIDALQAKGPTRMNDGLARGVSEALRAREGGRRAIILLSDGADTDSQVELAEALRPAVEAKIPVYTIGLGGDVKADVLEDIATQTAGRFYAAPRASDLDLVFKLLSGQLSSQYEAWWPSSTVLPAGSVVQGRMVLEAPGQSALEAHFSYVMPVFIRPQVREEVWTGSALTPVEPDRSASRSLPAWWPILAAALAGAGVWAAYQGLILRLTRSRIQERMSSFVQDYTAAKGRVLAARTQQHQQALRPLVLGLGRLGHRLTPTSVLDRLRHQLVLAGRPSGWHFSQFLAAKLILGGVLALIGFSTMSGMQSGPLTPLVAMGSLGGLGYYLPHFWLGSQIRARQKQIQRALPDALDLLTVGVGAGLSLDGAILEVSEKSNSALSQELTNFLAEMRMGRSRREALQGLVARTEVDDVRVLVSSLLQAEELGMSLSEALMIQADQMRQRRRQRAEEQAHKATVKMLIPMIMLIFPALFVVIMGPAVPSMLAFMQGGV